MTKESTESSPEAGYALTVASESYEWYKTAATRSRRRYRTSETMLLIVSAAIPASTSLAPGNTVAPAILGSIVVILAGMRAVFHWQENYLRFSRAREAVEGQRRLYLTAAQPYDSPEARDQQLVAAVTRIEQEEMGSWLKIATDQPKRSS